MKQCYSRDTLGMKQQYSKSKPKPHPHSTLQLRDNNVKVYDTPQSQGGRQQIIINDRQLGLHINGGHITDHTRLMNDEWEHLDKITRHDEN
jgi:hypothetical protein